MNEPKGAEAIRLVVIDDHELVLHSVIRLLEEEPDLSVVASAGTVADGLQAVREHVPDIVVLDYQLPDGDGPSAARAIHAAWPQVRIILLTGSGGDAASFEAARAGCVGYVEKTAAVGALVHTIRRVNVGDYELLGGHTDRLPQPEHLVLHYQPIVDLTTGVVMGYEALVRWQHPKLGLVQPGDFIGLAEQTTLIVDIGERVRDDACRQAAEWAAQSGPGGAAPFMSINLSGRELSLPDVPERVRRALEEAGLEPELLVIEVTESFFVDHTEENARKLYELKDLGARIALDDFGTGYSSLDYLRRFPIDIIKLDKSFTDELPHGPRGLRLVGAMGQLANDMGAVTEAEGIESAEQAACLLSLGWELGQGYFYGRPADAAAFS